MVKSILADRRAAARAHRILSIQHRLVKSKTKEADSNWHLSTTHDMSYLGLTFLSEVSYSIDDVLELQVVMSGVLDVVKGFGKVVRVEKKEMGALYLVAVRFTKYVTKKKGILNSVDRLKTRLRK